MRSLNTNIASVVRQLDEKPGTLGAKRALTSALEALSAEARRDLDQAEKDTHDAINNAVEKVEKRVTQMLSQHEKDTVTTVRRILDDGLSKLTDAVKARDLEQAESLVEKLRLALQDAKSDSGSTPDLGEISNAVTTAVKESMPKERGEYTATVSSRDSQGKVKTVRITPA